MGSRSFPFFPANPERLCALAEQYGTPLYLYQGDLVLERLQELRAALPWPSLRVLYALKANYNPAILALLREAGARVDAVSPGEVYLARAAGWPAEEILFTVNNASNRDVAEVVTQGVLCNIGSLSELDRFARAYPGAAVCLRINPEVEAGEHQKVQTAGTYSKFGILPSDMPRALEIVTEHQLRVVGLHQHVGSGIHSWESYGAALEVLLGFVDREQFPQLRFVDCGGGFFVPYRPQQPRFDMACFGAQLVAAMSRAQERFGAPLELWVEPGKFLVAECGVLVIEVTALRDVDGYLIAGTNSGFPQLIRPVLYGAYHHISNLSNPNGSPREYDIVGNICEGGDSFAERRSLPEVRVGDLLAVHHAGAYCYSMGGVYNLRPMPGEVLLRGNEVQDVRPAHSARTLAEAVLRGATSGN